MKAHLIAFSLIVTSLGWAFAQSRLFFSESVLFQSLESKTLFEEPVFNEIKWFSFKDKDVWMMNQSHFGKQAGEEQKDRLAIVIDKANTTKTAYFMQLKPGPLQWTEDLYQQRIAFKVSCFMCHANGLRAIRADWNGIIKSNLNDQFRINYLNFKIRSYGQITENKIHEEEDRNVKTPFRYRTHFENEVLNLKTCIKCHDGEKRSRLTRQNAIAIQFLIRNNFMPPNQQRLDSAEISQIQKFTDGF